MKSINLRVDRELFHALKAHKSVTGVPIQVFIRAAIRLTLFSDEKPKIETRGGMPTLVGSWPGGVEAVQPVPIDREKAAIRECILKETR